MLKFYGLLLIVFLGSFFLTRELGSVRPKKSVTLSFRSCPKASSKKIQTKNFESDVSLPCRDASVEAIKLSEKEYSKKILDEVSYVQKMIEKTLSSDSGKPTKYEIRILEDINKSTSHFKKVYPRFTIHDSYPDDYLNFGIHTGDYPDAARFLGQRVCSNPGLYFPNFSTAYLSLFFSINEGRTFGGIVKIINEKYVTPIEGNFSIFKVEDYFLAKRIPSGSFRSWVHEDVDRDFSGFKYQNQEIAQIRYGYESYLFMSPWLYNSCNKSISVIHNNCSLDPSFDMELKDFFYLTKSDLMLGNIYCKKSNETSWTRIATMEFIRI